MRSSRLLGVVIVAALLGGGVGVLAQGGWQVTGAEPLALPTSVGLRVFPAPDGRQVAFESNVRLNGHVDRFICVLDATSNTEPLCVDPPESQERSFDNDPRTHYWPLAWSPDSTKLIFVGQPLLNGDDSDLWVLDIASESWTNLTDDGYTGRLIPAEGEAAPPAGVSVEAQPAWSPDGSQIAVVWAVIGEDGLLGQGALTLVDAATGELTELNRIPGNLSHPQDASAITGLSWAPDGSALAFSLRHQELDPEVDGLWRIDAADGELTQIASAAALQALVHEAYAGVTLANIGPVAWSPDGSRLLFWAGDLGSTPVALWAFWLDVESGEALPIPLPESDRDTDTRRLVWPYQAAWSPDGSALLVAAIGSAPDETLDSLDPAGRARAGVRLITPATGESVLLGGLPSGSSVTFFLASWGEEGHALLNNYHLSLTAP